MGANMNEQEEADLKAMAAKLAEGVKSEKDLGDLTQKLVKLTVETALGAEMEAHLGYAKHDPVGRGSGNSRNGTTTKRLKGQHGDVELEAPRDRAGSFEPRFVRKGQTRLTQMDDQILALYAKGLSTRDIVAAFREMYGAEVSATLVSQVTERVLEAVAEWQSRPLDAVYPIVYLDCIVLKVRHNKRVVNKSMYVALGIGMDGHKQLLGLWLAETEGASFWLSVLTDLKNRGLQDILIACVDGLKAVRGPHGAQLAEVRLLAGLQGGQHGPQADLPGADRGSGGPGTGGLLAVLGWPVSPDQQVLDDPLAAPDHAVRVSPGDPPGDLHHQRHRIAQQRDPQGDTPAQDLPLRRLRHEGRLPGHERGFPQMDHADPQLEAGPEPLYAGLR